LIALLRRCVSAGWVSFEGVDRPVVTLTEDGRAVMKGERPARLLLPPPPGRADAESVGPRRTTPASDRAPARVARPEAAELDAAALALFEALRRHRLAVARAEGVAPFIVASDRTLRDIAALRRAISSSSSALTGWGGTRRRVTAPGCCRWSPRRTREAASLDYGLKAMSAAGLERVEPGPERFR